MYPDDDMEMTLTLNALAQEEAKNRPDDDGLGCARDIVAVLVTWAVLLASVGCGLYLIRG